MRLAIAAIVKNEAPYILEWVAYHRVVGIDTFFIADNGSDDGTTQLLSELDRAGIVIHIPFPGKQGQAPQLPAYAEIMRRHRNDADWFAFIDADEFLFPTDGEVSVRPTIADLAQIPDLGAIAINWACFGSNGHEKQTDDLVIERFSTRAEQDLHPNHHYKSIVRSSAWLGNHGTPHLFVLKAGYRLFQTDRQPVEDHPKVGPGLSRRVCWDRLRLNHYVVKSRQEFFERKGPKGRATVVGQTKGGGYFAIHDRNEIADSMPGQLLVATKAEISSLRERCSTSALQPRQMTRPGIAIVTYKRPDFLERCLSSIALMTPGPYELIVVCDADDDAKSRAICDAHGVQAVFASNRGVVWNKNRGLFHFMSRTACDPIILLEDDACPVDAGWLDKWVEAAARWDHVNFSYPKLVEVGGPYLAGDGTPGQPHLHKLVSGQCTAVSRHAVETGGYLDTRFKGYGHGHVEWSMRHASLLYKGKVDGFSDANMLFLSIEGGMWAEDAPTFRNEEDVTRNQELLTTTTRRTPDYLEPWQSDWERDVLQDEIGKPDTNIAADRADARRPAQGLILRGHVDVVSGRLDRFLVRGWAACRDGTPVPSFLLKIGDRTIVDKIVSRIDRPDVVRAYPDIRLDSGFKLAFDLSEEEMLACVGQRLSVLPVDDGVVGMSLHVGKSAAWPPPGWQPIPDAPTMPADGAARLEELLRGSRCYLEYGAGGSTVKACDLGVPVVISVESDRDWLEALGRKIMRRRSSSQLIPLHIDLGLVKDWGFPVAETHWKNYSNYALLAWEESIRRGLKPDLVLIDGRFRVACFMATLLFAQPGCRILFDDYGDRPDCIVVERFVGPSSTVGRVAEFVVPNDLPRDDAWLAFVQACTDVR